MAHPASCFPPFPWSCQGRPPFGDLAARPSPLGTAGARFRSEMARQAFLASPLRPLLLVLAGIALSGVAAAAPPPLPALPGNAPATPAAGPPAAAGPNDVNGFTADQVRRGVVQIE